MERRQGGQTWEGWRGSGAPWRRRWRGVWASWAGCRPGCCPGPSVWTWTGATSTPAWWRCRATSPPATPPLYVWTSHVGSASTPSRQCKARGLYSTVLSVQYSTVLTVQYSTGNLYKGIYFKPRWLRRAELLQVREPPARGLPALDLRQDLRQPQQAAAA